MTKHRRLPAATERVFGIKINWFAGGIAYPSCIYLIYIGNVGGSEDARRLLFMGCFGLFTTTYMVFFGKDSSQVVPSKKKRLTTRSKFSLRQTIFGSSSPEPTDVATTGRCTACGYSVDPEAEPCPKCGQPSPTKPSSRTVALLECRICGNSVSENADNCPKCDARPRFDLLKLFATAILTLALLGTAGAVASIWIATIDQLGKAVFSIVLFGAIGLAKLIVDNAVSAINKRKRKW